MVGTIISIIVAFGVGYIVGQINYDRSMNNRLRKRGYTIISEGYHIKGYYFVYTGFDKNMKPLRIKGHEFSDRKDAIANADAHYHAKILYDLDKPIGSKEIPVVDMKNTINKVLHEPSEYT